MYRFLVTLTLTFTVFFGIHARILKFEDIHHSAILEVKCIGLSQEMDSIAIYFSNKEGYITLDNDNVTHIHISHDGYNEKLISLAIFDQDTILLDQSVSLEEVVVTPKDMEEFVTHTSYRIPQADFKRYPNVLQSLNIIPQLTVLSTGAVFFEGNQNIILLIDGVESSIQEISALSKEDISKVDVYQTPPLRFLSQGIASVIDIRLKSKLHGGNGSIELTQALKSLKGNNFAAIFYNYRQSRFSLLFNNENQHYTKIRQSEMLDYIFEENHYLKTKSGLDSNSDLDENGLNASYQVNKPEDFLYNVNGGISVNRNGRKLKQEVSYDGIDFLASNFLHTGFNTYKIGNYIEKHLPGGSTLLANIKFQHYSTSYESYYNEDGESIESITMHSHSKYKTSMNSILSEIQYEFPTLKFGYLSLAAYETLHNNKYVDTAYPFYLKSNITGASAQWIGWRGKIQWYFTLGVDWFYTASSNMDKKQNLVIPSPVVNISWRPLGILQLSANYSFTGRVPSIAQLSETDQWLDNRLVYHGNATLKPYGIHSTDLRLNFHHKYVDFSVKGSFSSSPGMICDMYTLSNDYMLQTLVNLDRYQNWTSQLDITVKPLGDNRLTFWNRLIAANLNGRNKEYSWDGYRFQWMSQLSMNIDRWTATLYYQYPGKIVEGQLERPRAQCWSATLLYRPFTNLSVGIEWFLPFGSGLKESEHTVISAPVYADTEIFIKDRANMLSIKFSYNFSFGRNKNSARPQFDNVSHDSGILVK